MIKVNSQCERLMTIDKQKQLQQPKQGKQSVDVGKTAASNHKNLKIFLVHPS